MKKKFLLILLLVTSTIGYSQVNETEVKLKVKETATVMGQLLLEGNYDEFVKYMYKDAVSAAGGKGMIIKMITDGRTQMEKNGTSINDIEFGEPIVILTNENTLQCILPQFMTMNVKEGILKSEASLFAISSDNGEHWTFLDVTTKSMEQLKVTIPIIHNDLIIPAPTQPILYRN